MYEQNTNRLDIIYDEGADLTICASPQDVQQKTLSAKIQKDTLHEGIYFDMLEEMFIDGDGLYTRFEEWGGDALLSFSEHDGVIKKAAKKPCPICDN